MPPLKNPKYQLNETCNVLYKGKTQICKMVKEGHKYASVHITGKSHPTKVDIGDVSKFNVVITTPIAVQPVITAEVKLDDRIEKGKYYLEPHDDYTARIKQMREAPLVPRFVALLPKAYKQEATAMLKALNELS